ncbi:AAA family ATPase [Crocinitomicaceae bacterium]|nr:AAA family ATPase [Crocinitomicaceae bacterium]
MSVSKSILSKGQIINKDYAVKFFLKKGSYAETYRVKDKLGKAKFLKLFVLAKLDRTQFDENGDVLEIEILKKTNSSNVVQYYDSGELVLNGNKYAFVVLDFISGETLADKQKRERNFNKYEAKDIIHGVLNGLISLYSLDPPVIHNDITNQNVMIDLSGKIPIPKIIDFGYARFLSQSNKDFLKEGLNPFYQANESFNSIFTAQSDMFSVGALYYHILEGLPPWFIEISQYNSDVLKMEDAIIDQRRKPLKFSKIKDERTQFIIQKALQPQAENRFQNISEFIQAINGELNVEITSKTSELIPKTKTNKKGQGFKAIAGMQELKNQLKNDVIDVIENPEEYKKHNIGIPNGILLYGPPGCGKTFFAERFAEEANYHFIKVASSDIASIYIHGSQEKIGELFNEARKNAPAILYFDELDAMIPKRDNLNNASQSGEVNEFLTQLDNIGDSGVFVIGSTNKPDSIDIAALRAGRIEQLYYVSPPDLEARKGIFKLYLKDRSRDVGLKYGNLAEMTEDYVSSDIKLIIDKTSRKAINEKKKGNREESKITMNDLKFIIKNQKPTVKKSVLLEYEKLRKRIEGDNDDDDNNERTKIGF